MTKNEAIEKLVALARAQVGYLEKRTNAQLDDPKANAGIKNWNKYARDIDTKYPDFYNGKKNSHAWCDILIDWLFITAFGYENALKLLCAPEKSTGAGCKYSARFYRNKAQFFTSPKVGDQVFFGPYGDEGHTGIVVAVDGDYITTVEGNTSGGNGVDANGDGVYLKRYNIRSQYIPGYGRPDYSIVADAKEEPVYAEPVVPVKNKYVGIDLSGWQKGLTDGQLLKNGGIDFVILKITEGTTYINEAFDVHYKMCKEHGIPVGAYVYSHAIGGDQGRAEAEHALKALKGRKLDLPVYLDIEDHEMLASGKASIMAATRAFGNAIKAAGYKLGVYASLSRYGTLIDDEALKKEGYSIWCAAYNDSGAGMDCDIWQHTDKGKLSGYTGNLDFNIMYNTSLLLGNAEAPKAEEKPAVAEKTEEAKEETVMVKLTQLSKGDNGREVKAMQALLIKKFGIGCGTSGADGDFGYNTDKAVRVFQLKKKLEVDGICGENTWTALLVG